jgi:hypothetical protein
LRSERDSQRLFVETLFWKPFSLKRLSLKQLSERLIGGGSRISVEEE